MAPRAPARPLPNDPKRHHADFIQRFTQQESERRIAKRPKALTAAQYAALRNTKAVIKRADRAMAMDFLLYLCEVYRIKSWGTSWEYFRQYKQLYASVTGCYMDRNDSREVLKWHDATLVPLFDLQAPNSGGKDVADSGELLAVQTYNIAYDTSIFSWERHRINLSGCYLGLACTGARPAEFVDGEKKSPKDGCLEELFGLKAIEGSSAGKDEDCALDDDSRVLEEILSHETVGRGRPKCLYYEDILLMVVRHPDTGEDALAMSIKFIHHKGADNKPKPTVFFFTLTRRLIFCLITVIVSLAVHDGAFAAPSLTSVSRVFQVKNRGPVKCTPLRWKKEWLKRPVFHRFDGSIISANEPPPYEPVPYHQLRDDMARQSLEYGCERPIEPKAWRRGAANAANGNASDTIRDQMIRHDPKWATLNSVYINEKPTEDSLIGMLSHIGLMRDPRARKDMVPDEVWAEMPPDPEILALEAERAELKGGQYRITGTENEDRIRELTKLIAKKRAKRAKNIRREYREDYFHHRPTWDIEGQANGEEEQEYVEPAVVLRVPERAELAQILCKQPEGLSSTALLALRIRAGELMSILCGKRETVKRERIRQRAPADVMVKEESPGPDTFPLLMQRTQCPRYIGDESLSYEERTFQYCRPAVMNDHFDRAHARHMGDAKQIVCSHSKCKGEALKFEHLGHFKNYVEKT
ncbi:FluG domain-containing protein [Diplogelasinospora grovesii]|uniref:FluG domain-containing protein n=1 Tax=Diplogelasinospora grovesii TaxID=303347 RepID=A0AAN6MWL2_9PEZI|nr:FluG domain-containing protein [Diplogelasinospora grovesii]